MKRSSTVAANARDRSFRGARVQRVCAAIVLVLVCLFASPVLHAEPYVGGDRDDVRVEARNTSVDELLKLLGDRYGVTWQSSQRLERRLTGTYRGPLQRVLARILDGNNYILRTHDKTMSIIVLATRPAAGGPSPSPHPAAPVTASPGSPPADQATAANDSTNAKQPEGAIPPEALVMAGIELPQPAVDGKGPVPEMLPSTMTLVPSTEAVEGPKLLNIDVPLPTPVVKSTFEAPIVKKPAAN